MSDFLGFIQNLLNILADFCLKEPAKYILFVFLFLAILSLIFMIIRRR
jgi:hypothetical protein